MAIDEVQFGELIGKVNSIKENTDKIPHLTTKLAEHELRLNSLEPLVKNHEKLGQRAIAVSALFGTLAGMFSWIIRDNSH